MAKLIAFYSRADENYFGGQYRYVKVGNTEKVANHAAPFAERGRINKPTIKKEKSFMLLLVKVL